MRRPTYLREVGDLPDGSVFATHWGPRPYPEDGVVLKLLYKTQGGAYVQPTRRETRTVQGKTFSVPQSAYMISLGSPVHTVVSLGGKETK